jgi:hypothetical protein
VIEDTKGIYSIYDDNDEAGKMNKKKRSIPLPPGNVVYSNEFIEVWHKIVEKEEEDELYIFFKLSRQDASKNK